MNKTGFCWHDQTTEDVIKAFNTGPSGLSPQDVQKRLLKYGPNRLPKPSKQSLFIRVLHQFDNVLIYVLLASALITAILQHWVDTSVIVAVVLVNALIGLIQEGKAEKALDAIRDMLAPGAIVLRQGERETISGEELVPGDLVFLNAGDKVPADLRLITVHSLVVQEAILTGESVPVDKQSEPVSIDSALGDRSCMAYSGTLVTHGQAMGLVVSTGRQTEIGLISNLLSHVQPLSTPLLVQMGEFARLVTSEILLIAFFLLIYGAFIQHQPFTELFMAVVSLSVAAIPEGLPAVLTITMAIGVQAMAKKNSIIRSLPAIETLGAVSVICTDKTGTLTSNEMMVASVITAGESFTVTGHGYEPIGEIQHSGKPIQAKDYPLLNELAEAITLCNNASLFRKNGTWSIQGNPMEAALLCFASKTGLILDETQAAWTHTDTIPFDANHRYMAVLEHNHEHQAFIFVKGAPENILSISRKQKTQPGKTEPLNAPYWHQQIEAISSKGQRVLAIGLKPVRPNKQLLEFSDVEDDLIFLGLVGLIDPPRPEAALAIAQCHAAGIQVKMITGDHASTAVAIAKSIGLKHCDKALRGVDLDKMSDEELVCAAATTNVFARTSPEHKLRLVIALQSLGMTVAMTGDGVNDAPALKRADAGIAMGKKGSEVAKEAADLVIADDNFASIVQAIREGRTVYDNLKKVISWTLPTSSGEAITVVIALLLGMSLPVTPIQILWINLITATTLGISLAFEPTEENTMNRPPRRRNAPLLGPVLVWQIVFVSLLFAIFVFGIYSYAIERGYGIELARSIALNTLVMMEIVHLFFIRNIYGTSLTWQAVQGTQAVWISIVVISISQMAITYLPAFQALFDTRAIGLFDSLLILGLGLVFFAIIELEKQIRLFLYRRYQQKSS